MEGTTKQKQELAQVTGDEQEKDVGGGMTSGNEKSCICVGIGEPTRRVDF